MLGDSRISDSGMIGNGFQDDHKRKFSDLPRHKKRDCRPWRNQNKPRFPKRRYTLYVRIRRSSRTTEKAHRNGSDFRVGRPLKLTTARSGEGLKHSHTCEKKARKTDQKAEQMTSSARQTQALRKAWNSSNVRPARLCRLTVTTVKAPMARLLTARSNYILGVDHLLKVTDIQIMLISVHKFLPPLTACGFHFVLLHSSIPRSYWSGDCFFHLLSDLTDRAARMSSPKLTTAADWSLLKVTSSTDKQTLSGSVLICSSCWLGSCLVSSMRTKWL